MEKCKRGAEKKVNEFVKKQHEASARQTEMCPLTAEHQVF